MESPAPEPSIVFVLEKDWGWDGSTIVGVFQSAEAAIRAAQKESDDRCAGGELKRHHDSQGDYWAPSKGADPVYRVQPFEVRS